MTKGAISKIESLGLVDGPGIRVVVFMEGCELRCLFCHNPEMWTIKKYNYEVEELVNKILRYKPYFNNGGGVTFSGGEPLLQSKFILEVSKELKKQNIHIALDTSGVGSDYEKLLDYIDLVILDIKAITDDKYLEITKRKIDKFEEFVQKINKKNIPVWIRQVIIPNINDNEEYILELKEYIKKINNIEKIELLPYHTMGINKYEQLNINYLLKNTPAMDLEKTKNLEQLLKK